MMFFGARVRIVQEVIYISIYNFELTFHEFDEKHGDGIEPDQRHGANIPVIALC